MTKTIIITLILLSLSLMFTACKKAEKKDDEGIKQTKKPVVTATAEVTATPVPTATPVRGPTIKPISAEEKGKPHKDAEVIVIEDFDDGEIDKDNFKTQGDENIVILDGEMHVETVWSAIAPLYEDYGIGTKHNQYEWSSDVYITHKQGDAPRVAY